MRIATARSHGIALAMSVLAVVCFGAAATAQVPTGPDVTVGEIVNVSDYTFEWVQDDFNVWHYVLALSMEADSCNAGDQPLSWLSLPDNGHPVIAQNMYRTNTIRNHRLEQIGQAWVKHGFLALQENLCFNDCQPDPTGDTLGVHCSDPYWVSLNRGPNLGARSEINPVTGFFDGATADNHTGHPHGTASNTVQHGLQVYRGDFLNNFGARYFVEVQYVAPDDALSGNGNNNVSYREVLVTHQGFVNWTFTVVGPTIVGEPAIMAWPGATFGSHDTWPVDGKIIVASKATHLGGQRYLYEYAVYNMNSERGIGSFAVPTIPGVSNAQFSAPPSHEEGLSNVPWGHNYGAGGMMTWSTQTFAVTPNANAIRWGTMYTFSFEVFAPPVPGVATLKKFKPGSDPETFTVDVLRPQLGDCNGNGINDVLDVLNCAPGDPACADCNVNYSPDGCEVLWNDCNGNGVPDDCDLAAGTAIDCDASGTPDSCELVGNDCNGDGTLDACQMAGNDCNVNNVLDACEGNPICFNDTCGQAVTMCPGTVSGHTNLATTDGSSSCSGVRNVWFAYTPGSDGAATVDTCGSILDTVLSVHTGCPGTAVNELACSGNDPLCGSLGENSTVTIPVVAGETYLIRVASTWNEYGSYDLSVAGPQCGAACAVDADCPDDGNPCTIEFCSGAGTCASTATTLPCESFILSKNADFSTDDRTFAKNDTIYMRVVTNQVDFNDIDKAKWQLIDAGGKKVNKPMTNHLDGSYTASWDLAQLPSNSVGWTFSGEILDKVGHLYAPMAAMVVQPQCTIDADCSDGIFCNGAESCDTAQVCLAGNDPCNGNQVCDEVGDICFTPVCGDGVCNGTEDRCVCPLDCGAAPATETDCADGADEDCDGLIDCDDVDCAGDPSCPSCLPLSAPCTADIECCGGRCRLVNSEMICD